MKGFFGTLDVSIDYTTKGMNGFIAYPYSLAPGVTSPTGPFVQGPAKGGGAGPYGRVGWLAAMSSNGSNVGYRGTHQIADSHVDFIYQVSTAIDMAAAPGLNNTWTKSSNTVTGAIGLGDTYLGFQTKELGKLKFGTMYMPYKTSTDRLNPFSGTRSVITTVDHGQYRGRQPYRVRHPHGSRDPVQLAHLVWCELRCRLRTGSERGPQQQSDPQKAHPTAPEGTTRVAGTCS